ncbi:hypothetical protein [Tissierella sp.]|uniref:hypothetical protein n=1 Tax=Tissierella sp. TaxID=41274 RepID=UPI00286470C6|nr:hypothetical protein [Tissierella sp.]MDR7856906.1 hypothetical protein [Tissierella sp.]
MAYEICKSCGKMFEKDGKPYCMDCNEKIGKENNLIMEYIREHPASTIMEIIMETGVSLKSIDRLVKDGNISYVENKDIDQEDVAKVIEKLVSNKGKFHIRENL